MARSVWLDEIRRRGVPSTLLAYGVAVFAVLQVVEPVLHALRLPESALTVLVLALCAGFPAVVIGAWLLGGRRRPASRGAWAERARNRRTAIGVVGVVGLLAATRARTTSPTA